MKLSDFDHIAWDFNGTILDDVQIGIDSVNVLLTRRRKPIIPDRDYYRRIFGFPIVEYYVRAGFDFSTELYETVAHEWIKEYRAREKDAPLRAGVLPLLSRLSSCGIPMTVLSATESGMLREQIRDLGVAHFFTEICGNGDVYASSKEAMVTAWAASRRPGRVLMIGDTPHDAAVAKAAGFTPALVAGGHATREALTETGAAVYRDFDALAAELL